MEKQLFTRLALGALLVGSLSLNAMESKQNENKEQTTLTQRGIAIATNPVSGLALAATGLYAYNNPAVIQAAVVDGAKSVKDGVVDGATSVKDGLASVLTYAKDGVGISYNYVTGANKVATDTPKASAPVATPEVVTTEASAPVTTPAVVTPVEAPALEAVTTEVVTPEATTPVVTPEAPAPVVVTPEVVTPVVTPEASAPVVTQSTKYCGQQTLENAYQSVKDTASSAVTSVQKVATDNPTTAKVVVGTVAAAALGYAGYKLYELMTASPLKKMTTDELFTAHQKMSPFIKSLTDAYVIASHEINNGMKGTEMQSTDEIFGKIVVPSNHVYTAEMTKQLERLKTVHSTSRANIAKWIAAGSKTEETPDCNGLFFEFGAHDKTNTSVFKVLLKLSESIRLAHAEIANATPVVATPVVAAPVVETAKQNATVEEKMSPSIFRRATVVVVPALAAAAYMLNK